MVPRAAGRRIRALASGLSPFDLAGARPARALQGFMALTNLIAGRWRAANLRADRFGRPGGGPRLRGGGAGLPTLELFGPLDSPLGGRPTPLAGDRLPPAATLDPSRPDPGGPGGTSVDSPGSRVIPSRPDPRPSGIPRPGPSLRRIGASLWVAEPIGSGSTHLGRRPPGGHQVLRSPAGIDPALDRP